MEANPYQPPSAKLIDEAVTSEVELADRGQRFGAALLDGILGLAVVLPIMFFLGTWDYVRQGQQLPRLLAVATVALGFLGFVLLHGYYLKIGGQTIGKKIVGIRIVDLDNNVPPLAKVLGLRYLPTRAVRLDSLRGRLFADDRRAVYFSPGPPLHSRSDRRYEGREGDVGLTGRIRRVGPQPPFATFTA
jgi:hypothetical protein